MEDDYYVNGNYGELEILERHFELRSVRKYDKGSWQWPFITFQIKGRT